MARKSNRGVIIGIFLVVIILGSILMFGRGVFFEIGGPTDFWQGCTWDPDYCFASCVEHGSTIVNIKEQPGYVWQCPSGADVHQCKITAYSTYGIPIISTAGIYTACAQTGWFGAWECTNKISGLGLNVEIGRGQYIYWPSPVGGGWNIFQVKVIRKTLERCGTAACLGGGIPIIGAQGCSWNIGDSGYEWEDGTTGVKSIPFETGFTYVCSQHLVSCPSQCTEPMACSVPSNLRHWVQEFAGQNHNVYVGSGVSASGERIANVIGCKTISTREVCTEKDLATGECLSGEYETVVDAQCGVISTFNVGACALDSDCGAIGDYYCDWDSSAHSGICKPVPIDEPIHECETDYDCSQTGSGCLNRVIKGVLCIDYNCELVETRDVECCISGDCPSGYFCNPQYNCQFSDIEAPDCPYDCCDQVYNPTDGQYKSKTCPSAASVCCPEHVCKATQDECGDVAAKYCNYNGICEPLLGENQESCPDDCILPEISFDWLIIIAFAGIFGLFGYAIKKGMGAVIGLLIGGIIGYAFFVFTSMPFWQQILLFLGLIGISGIFVYLIILAIPLIIAVVALLARRGK